MLLHFLTRDPEGGQGSVRFGGVDWRLTDYESNPADVDEVPFTCISYAWGSGRERNPFHPSHEMSDRTKPALDAVVSHRPSLTRLWVDAFCVPSVAPARNHTIASMGYIYSRAEEVIVVLSSSARPVLAQMSTSDRLETKHLDILEAEEWVSRAWTYQEAVNSRQLFITCEGPGGAVVERGHFLNCLGYTLTRLHGASQKREKYPRLDAFEDVIADCLAGNFGERSALEVMSNMDRRCAVHDRDRFYAMMGVLSVACPRFDDDDDARPCEAFMALCEGIGDYSFIYSAAKRDVAPGRRWRPVPDSQLPPILSWYCWGPGQPAHEESGSLYLDQMVVLDIRPIGEGGEAFVRHHIADPEWEIADLSRLEVAAYAALEVMGFKGSADCFPTTHGFFFPAETMAPSDSLTILVTTGVRWKVGAPGLARHRGHDNTDSYMPGVFFGLVDTSASTSVKMS